MVVSPALPAAPVAVPPVALVRAPSPGTPTVYGAPGWSGPPMAR
jgi:hypothetical protein